MSIKLDSLYICHMSSSLKSFYFTLCFLTSCLFNAYTQNLDIKFLTTHDGLSGNTQWSVNSVVKDKRGFLWFITMGGLNRWDGYSIKSYSQVTADQKDLPNNLLSAIAVDKNNNLWIGTQEEGVLFFDSKKETFKAIDFKKITKNGIDISQINRIIIDSNNILYILAGFQGLFKYDIDQNKFEPYAQLNSKIGGGVSDMIVTKKGEIIVAATNGFFHIHAKDKFEFYEKPYENFVRTMLELEDDQLYIFLQNVKNHYILNLKEKSLKLYDNTLPYLAINGMIDQENNFWISYLEGILSKQNLYTKKIESFPLTTMMYNHEVTVGLLDMHNTPDHKTYFMSLGTGAGIIDRSKKLIEPFLGNGYANLKIIGEDFYCTKGSVLHKLKNGVFEKLVQLEAKFNDHYIMNYHISKDHGIYISHLGNRAGLSHFDLSGKLLKPGEIMNCGSMYTQIEEDSLCWEMKSMKAYPIHFPIKFIGQYYSDLSHKEIPDFKVKHYRVLNNGEIWMATFKDGVIRIYDNRKKYENFSIENKKLNSNNAYYIFSYSNGDVYIITDIGINIWHAKTNQFTYHTFPENRSSNYVYGMIEDASHRIWILQGEKLLCYDQSKDAFYSMPITDQYKVEMENELQIDKKGNIYYQGHNGIFTFHPDKFFAGDAPSSVLFTDLYVNRNRVFPDDQYKILDSSIIDQRHLEVPFKYRDLGFAFVSLNGKDCDATYYYRLKGYNDEWLATKDERTIHFTNIDPGTYTFEVKAISGNGKETPTVSQIFIKVLPPWYQRWWAYLLYTIVLSSLAYLVYRLRIKQILKYQSLRTKISSDLHDDVGTILTGISMQSELMSYTSKDEEKSTVLELSQMSRDAMEKMRDIVWALDSRKDNYNDLITKMKEYAETMLGRKGITYNFTLNINPTLKGINPEQRQNLYFIYKEAVANIIKHSTATKVEIILERKTKETKMMIKDNGIITQNQETSGQGLSNIKMRAKRIGGEVFINQENGYAIAIIF
jgi:two-component sensor histidine kinase/streptogramin lyase